MALNSVPMRDFTLWIAHIPYAREPPESFMMMMRPPRSVIKMIISISSDIFSTNSEITIEIALYHGICFLIVYMIVPTKTPDRIDVITSFVMNAKTSATNGGSRDRKPAFTGSKDANVHNIWSEEMYETNSP